MFFSCNAPISFFAPFLWEYWKISRQTKKFGLKIELIVQENLSRKQIKNDKKYTSYIVQNVEPKGVGRGQVEES